MLCRSSIRQGLNSLEFNIRILLVIVPHIGTSLLELYSIDIIRTLSSSWLNWLVQLPCIGWGTEMIYGNQSIVLFRESKYCQQVKENKKCKMQEGVDWDHICLAHQVSVVRFI